MNERMVSRILASLEGKTEKVFEYNAEKDYFITSTTGLGRKLIKNIQDVFAGETYEMLDCSVKENNIIIPYVLCKCHTCSILRKKANDNSLWECE